MSWKSCSAHYNGKNLFEFAHEDFPGERLIVCRNPQLAQLRAAKRLSMLEATTKELQTVQGMVANARLKGEDTIGVRVGKVVNKYKMSKHFVLEIDNTHFAFHIDEEKVAEEAALDGLYVIRTCLPVEQASSADAVRHYKGLSHVEAAFRSLKSDDLRIRPIHHYTEDRVRAHLFLCMLAYYVKWHMSESMSFAIGEFSPVKVRPSLTNSIRTSRVVSLCTRRRRSLRLRASRSGPCCARPGWRLGARKRADFPAPSVACPCRRSKATPR